MDPLTITTSCVALLNGISTLSVGLTCFVKKTRDARKDVEEFNRELSSLQMCVTNLKDEEFSFPPHLQNNLGTVLGDCGGVIKAMQNVLDKHNRNNVGRRMMWSITDRDEVVGLRTRLEAHKATLDITLDLANLITVKHVQEDTTVIREDTTIIREDVSGMKAELEALRAEVSRLRFTNAGTNPMLDRYLSEAVAYTESVVDPFEDGNDDYSNDALTVVAEHSEERKSSLRSQISPEPPTALLVPPAIEEVPVTHQKISSRNPPTVTTGHVDYQSTDISPTSNSVKLHDIEANVSKVLAVYKTDINDKQNALLLYLMYHIWNTQDVSKNVNWILEQGVNVNAQASPSFQTLYAHNPRYYEGGVVADIEDGAAALHIAANHFRLSSVIPTIGKYHPDLEARGTVSVGTHIISRKTSLEIAVHKGNYVAVKELCSLGASTSCITRIHARNLSSNVVANSLLNWAQDWLPKEYAQKHAIQVDRGEAENISTNDGIALYRLFKDAEWRTEMENRNSELFKGYYEMLVEALGWKPPAPDEWRIYSLSKKDEWRIYSRPKKKGKRESTGLKFFAKIFA